MKNEMITAFEMYFARLNALYNSTFETKPTVPYSENLDKTLLVDTPDEDGQIQWIPKRQEKVVDWKDIESKLGFTICKDLKDYYSTYFFLALSGTFGDCDLHFYKIDNSEPVATSVIRNYKDAQYMFPKTEIFLLGNAVVNNDDNYFIYYDNLTQKLFCYEADTKKEVFLSYTVAKTISTMEALL